MSLLSHFTQRKTASWLDTFLDRKGNPEPAVERVRGAFGVIEPDTEWFWLSDGDWSLEHVLGHVVDALKPADVIFVNWALANRAASRLVAAVKAGFITSLAAGFHWRMRYQRSNEYAILKAAEAEHPVRVKDGDWHAKVFVVSSAVKTPVRNIRPLSAVILTSANLTDNPRVEQGYMTTAPAAVNYWRTILHAGFESKHAIEAAAQAVISNPHANEAAE